MSNPVILCVDDEKTILNSLKEQLLDHLSDKYDVEIAESGEEALELFEELLEEQYEIPLVISDCIMPDIKGDELLIKIHAISPDSLKIMLTGQTDTKTIVNAVNNANLYRYIPKPWQVEDLMLTVSEALKSYYIDQQLEEQNKALIKRTEELSKALEDLKTTQQELIQAEKMAALGQLIAGIAHEINTPLGAISSSANNISDALRQTWEQLPKLFQILTVEQQNNLFVLLDESLLQKNITLSIREKRAAKKVITAKLEEQNIENAIFFTNILINLGIYDDITTCLPLLQNSQSEFIFETAYKLSTLAKSNRTIKIASERAYKIIFALKNFARYDHTGNKLKFNLEEGIETVLTLYHNQIKHGTELVTEYANLPALEGYPDELNQVWTNLIHNALQAMDYKGTLNVTTFQKDNSAVVTVTDSGKGIPEDIKDKIFTPFFTTKPPGEGSGLGLDIVRKIIDKHDGKIEIDTEIDKGTTFSI